MTTVKAPTSTTNNDPRLLIKPRREELGLSQLKLAQKSGVARADISLIERLEINLGPKRARMLEVALRFRRGTLWNLNKAKASKA